MKVKQKEFTLDYKNQPKATQYRNGAAKRGLAFELTDLVFFAMASQSCHYCGSAGPNGIDRVDNKRGYSPDNCVPCCKHCNYAKGALPLPLWLEYIDRLVKRHGCV